MLLPLLLNNLLGGASGTVYNVGVTESSALTDAQLVMAALTTSATETGALIDSRAVTAAFMAAVSEPGALADSPGGTLTTTATVAEAAGLAESSLGSWVAYALMAEALAAIDTTDAAQVSSFVTVAQRWDYERRFWWRLDGTKNYTHLAARGLFWRVKK